MSALVTGAGRGIGAAITQALGATGRAVAVTDRDAEAANATAARTRARVAAWRLDVTDRAGWAAVVPEIEAALGPIDLLVANAGRAHAGPLLTRPADEDDGQIDVNLRGVLNGVRAVAPRMVARRQGRIVLVASVAGWFAVPGAAVYCATKHAVVGLAGALREELGPHGVGVTLLLPGFVRTELISGLTPPRGAAPVAPERVAAALVDGLRRGADEVVVPPSLRLAQVLPPLVPLAVRRRLARWLGLDRAFVDVDDAARRAYDLREHGGPRAPPAPASSGG